MSNNYIIDINDENFEYEVLQYSLNTPVVIDFWAEWCKPCKELTPILEMFAHQAAGSFRLARINVDQSPNLALRFGVRTVPTIKAITQTEVVAEMAGPQSEHRVRSFLASITPPSPFNLAIEKADGLFNMHQYDEAEKIYTALFEQAPGNPASLLGLAKISILRMSPQISMKILHNFPASRQYSHAQNLLPLAETLVKIQQRKLEPCNDYDNTFENSLNLAARGNFAAALDGLLGVLKRDKNYRNGLARENFLAILEMMPEDDPDIRSYRAELAGVLF